MLSVLRTLPEEAFEAMPFGSEGLWSKVMRACRNENSIGEILAACKSKRYAMSRLKRMLLSLYLGLSREDLRREIPYLRVLAFNDRGRTLLKEMKDTAMLPVITKPGSRGQYKNTALCPLLQLDADAAVLYQLLNGNIGVYGTYFTTSPLYVK